MIAGQLADASAAVGPVAHQAAVNYVLSIGVHGRYLVACRQLHYFVSIVPESSEAADDERAGSALDKGRYVGLEIQIANLRYSDLSPHRTPRCEHVPLHVLGRRRAWNG